MTLINSRGALSGLRVTNYWMVCYCNLGLSHKGKYAIGAVRVDGNLTMDLLLENTLLIYIRYCYHSNMYQKAIIE